MSTPSTSSEVRFGEWITEGFRMFTEQWKAWVLQTFVLYAIIFALTGIGFLGFVGIGMVATSSMEAAAPLLMMLLFAPLIVILMIASCGFVCGMYKSAFKQLQGGRIEMADLFSGWDRFFPVLGATMCSSILVIIGLAFLIIPGIIISALLYFTVPLIVHRKIGVFEAMRTSKEVIQKNLFMFILFIFVVHFIAQAGIYLCYIGLLATLPLQFTIGVVAYRDCFGVAGARSFQPPPQTNLAPYGLPAGSAPNAVPPQMMTCQFCETPMPPGARFCPACGGRVG
jgi:hypothetical protein